MDVLRNWQSLVWTVISLSVSSCWSPVFNVDISLAALSTSKMSLDAKFDAGLNVPSNAKVLAVPSRERKPSAVAVLLVSPTNFSITMYSNTANGWSASNSSNQTNFNTPLPDVDLLSPQYGLTSSDGVAVFLPTQGVGLARILTASGSSDPVLSPTASPLLGATSYPSSAAQVDLYLLGIDSTNTNNLDVYVGTGGLTASLTAASGSLLAPVSSLSSSSYGWYAYDPGNQVVYVTHHDVSGGRYTTDRVDGISTATWTRKDRVVAFLTTGELLTRDGGYYDVCDGNGAIKYSFPAGSLRFAQEYLDANGVPRCAFTEVYSANGSDNGSGVKIAVYSLPSNNLSSLK